MAAKWKVESRPGASRGQVGLRLLVIRSKILVSPGTLTSLSMSQLEFSVDVPNFLGFARWPPKLPTVGNADPKGEDKIRALVEHDNDEVERCHRALPMIISD